MTRGRGSKKRGWPMYLYESNGYFWWRHPGTREEYPLGRDRAQAFAQAVEANLHILKLSQQPRLIHRLTGEGDRTVVKWLDKYLAFQQEYLKLKENTFYGYRGFARIVVKKLGADTPLQSVKSLQVADLLHAIAVTDGSPSTARNLRSWLKDSFARARVDGWYEGDNPVLDAKLNAKPKVKRARLSFEVFMQAYAATEHDWLRNAMALGLVSAQRRQDVAIAKFKDFKDGFWHVTQLSEKATNPHRIMVPLEQIRLNVFDKSLADVISQCRRTGVASQYLVHRTASAGRAKVGAPVGEASITNAFTAAVAQLGIDWEPKTPPTFHEIRSLAARLFRAQGGINTQHLLGHDHAQTTATYQDARGDEWVVVRNLADLIPKADAED